MDKLKQNKCKQPLLGWVLILVAVGWIAVSVGLALFANFKFEDAKQKSVDGAKTLKDAIDEKFDSSMETALERRTLDTAILVNPVSTYRDEQTGLEYLIAPNGSMLPRLDADGKQIKGVENK